MPICIYPPFADDFSTNGLGILTPIECTIEEAAAGMYELEMVHPIDETLRWMQLQNGCIIKAPAPVRESPLYEAPAMTDPVLITRQVWTVTGSSSGRYMRTGPGSKYKKICKRSKNEEVIELEDAADPWKLVCAINGGQVGYMSTKHMKPSRLVDELIEPSKPIPGSILRLGQSRDQLFRIYSVEQDSEAGTVTIKAMHVFYDDAGNMINAAYEANNADVAEVMAKIKKEMHAEPEVSFKALNLEGRITGDYSYKTPIEAYMDPDEGIIAQTGAMLIRDNWDAYLLPSMTRDMGVTVRRGKNLIGVEVTNDVSDVVTRIIPIGKDADGNPMGTWGPGTIDSPHMGDYPFPRIKRIEYDVQTGQNGFDQEWQAKDELWRLAQEEYSKNGADLPKYGMKVDFVLLQNTAEYKNFASLQAVHLYDTVTIIDEMIYLKAKARVTAYKWDCITKQYKSVTLGELQDVDQTVYSFELPTGGVSGIKIAGNSLPGTALRNASIEYAKIGNAAIEKLSADAITALTARIQEIVTEKLTTDELYAAYAEMIALKVGTITADNIETDRLAAELARITVLTAGTATFDKATIQHLVAEALNLEYGVAGQVFIKNLAVEYAQMVSATVGELCIKASDGNYYLLDVRPDGTISATKTSISSDEANAGQTAGGKMILETSITAANLNTGNLLATYALINQIDAARINVDQLFAREAFIELLRTSQIFGGQSLTMIAERSSRNFRQEDMPTGDIKIGDTWVIPSLGIMYQAADARDLQLKFYLSDDGSLYYEAAAEDELLSMEGYDLYSNDLAFSTDEDGNIISVIRWKIVTDLSGIEAVQDELYSKQLQLEGEQTKVSSYIKLDPDMVRIGKEKVTSEFQIDAWGAGVAINNIVFSRFESDRVRFGNMEIRKPVVGGLAFDSITDVSGVKI